MPRSIAGHGRVNASNPPPTLIASPDCVRISGLMPGNGIVADPGFVGVTPGSGLIMIPPVSVCHHVSTIGHRSPPMYVWYQIHASGLIGSPTVPMTRRLDR